MSKKISDRRLKKAEELIYSYIIKDYNYRGTLGSAEGEEMPKDLSSAILYESSFKECVWGESNWDSLSGNGSKFTSCDFLPIKYTMLLCNILCLTTLSFIIANLRETILHIASSLGV